MDQRVHAALWFSTHWCRRAMHKKYRQEVQKGLVFCTPYIYCQTHVYSKCKTCCLQIALCISHLPSGGSRKSVCLWNAFKELDHNTMCGMVVLAPCSSTLLPCCSKVKLSFVPSWVLSVCAWTAQPFCWLPWWVLFHWHVCISKFASSSCTPFLQTHSGRLTGMSLTTWTESRSWAPCVLEDGACMCLNVLQVSAQTPANINMGHSHQ